MSSTHPPYLPHLTSAQAKAAAKNLRARRETDSATELSHSEALESISRSAGFRDWNTYSAALKKQEETLPSLQPGMRVGGRYLGHAFLGTVYKVAPCDDGLTVRAMLHLDEPVDVVASDLFSGFRQRITGTLGPAYQTVERLGDGTPHLVIDRIIRS